MIGSYNASIQPRCNPSFQQSLFHYRCIRAMNMQTLIQEFHVVPGVAVKGILAELRREAIEVVAQTYLAHERGDTINPDKYFLRFPSEPGNRIIALTAAITDTNGDQSVSGLKWVASYPANIRWVFPAASPVLILNYSRTVYPYAILEGALISAQRTAASAVLGARCLNGPQKNIHRLSIVGGGVISRNILHTFIINKYPFETTN